MSKSFDFLWIDDDESRKKTAENLEKNTGAKVRFHNVSGKDLAKLIQKLLMQQPEPDLVIVDHKLDKSIGALSCTPLKATGATAAEVIKDSYPNMPVICVTKVDLDKDITFAQKAAYDAIFNAAHLTKENKIIIAIVKGFRELKKKPPKDERELLEYLDCPLEDGSRLLQVLPNDVKTGVESAGYASVLWHWVSNVLFERPGFLYDSLWAATLVGSKESSFLKVQEKLESARYKGIFSNDVHPRWWVSRILEILYKSDYANEEENPRLLGRAYLNIPTQGYSKCEISKKDLPDAVAYSDLTNKNRYQVCLQFTQEHPGFQKLLFFEEIRMVKEEQ